ncbi:hypothetical protein BRADI_3g11592v3 [Brachypodium distachyon]|uniref:Uncharacterized protein n=1 Tax=Brachypodium distachyon TaxID=15368 RepID=A0A2K2CWP3_BRADI|nr:hypothetical protein BRADI_3g11592v3 [Brachypodium distachyon]
MFPWRIFSGHRALGQSALPEGKACGLPAARFRGWTLEVGGQRIQRQRRSRHNVVGVLELGHGGGVWSLILQGHLGALGACRGVSPCGRVPHGDTEGPAVLVLPRL